MRRLSVFALLAVLCFATFAAASPYNSYLEVPEGTIVKPGSGEQPTTPPSSFRSLVFFVNRANFQAICPGLVAENFSGTSVPPNSVQACNGPFNSATNNSCFLPGAIVDGISLDVRQGLPQQMVVLTPPFLGVTAVSVGPNTFLDDLDVEFTGPVNAFGADFVNPFGNCVVQVEVFGPGGSLGTTLVSMGVTPTFWGVVSDTDTFTRIEFTDGQGSPEDGELLQNIEFGRCGATPVESRTWGSIKNTYSN